MRRLQFLLSTCAAALLAGSATAQDVRERPDAPPPRAGAAAEREAGFYRASEILGTTVRGSDGQEIGQIQDLLIERQSQQIRYFILGEGDAIDAQASLRVVPWRAARPTFEGEDRFVTVRVEQQRLEQAPTLTWQEIQSGPATWSTEVDRFYGIQGRAGDRGRDVEIEGDRRRGRDLEDRARPGADRPRRGEVELERDGDLEIEGRDRPERPRADRPGVNVRPNGDVEVRPRADREGNVEVEGRVRPDGNVEIEAEGDE